MPRAPLFSKLRVRHPKDRVVPNLLCFSRNAFFPLGVRFSRYATVHILRRTGKPERPRPTSQSLFYRKSPQYPAVTQQWNQNEECLESISRAWLFS